MIRHIKKIFKKLSLTRRNRALTRQNDTQVVLQDKAKAITSFQRHSIDGNGTLILNANAICLRETSKLVIDNGGRLTINGTVRFYTNSYIHVGKNAHLEIGNNTYFNDGLKLSVASRCIIGSNCAISNNVTILDSDFHKIKGNEKPETGVHIGDHVWIGADAAILKNVTIGSNCIIGAHALVTKDVPDNCMAVGIPAKIIKNNIGWE